MKPSNASLSSSGTVGWLATLGKAGKSPSTQQFSTVVGLTFSHVRRQRFCFEGHLGSNVLNMICSHKEKHDDAATYDLGIFFIGSALSVGDPLCKLLLM